MTTVWATNMGKRIATEAAHGRDWCPSRRGKRDQVREWLGEAVQLQGRRLVIACDLIMWSVKVVNVATLAVIHRRDDGDYDTALAAVANWVLDEQERKT